MRVELAALVALGDVELRRTFRQLSSFFELTGRLRGANLGEVALAGPLDVLGRLDNVDALERVLGDQARAVAGLGAPRDLVALRVADRGPLRRSVDCERGSEGSVSQSLTAQLGSTHGRSPTGPP